MKKTEFKAGLVALVGPPNSGKSTLLNALVGQKVSIVAPKPQTTRLSIRGMVNRPGLQLVFVDTPGLLKPKNLMEQGMRKAALDALKDADVVLVVVSPDTEKNLEFAEGVTLPAQKSVLLINKADAYPKDRIFSMAVGLLEKLKLDLVLNVSAQKRAGLEELMTLLEKRSPVGPALFPEDDLSDMTLRQSAAEIIREKALLFTGDEVPHAVAVAIESYKEREDGLQEVEASIFVERESQKGILIGKAGSMLKKIGTAARQDMEKLSGEKVFLKLWVKVEKDWKKNRSFLNKLGMQTAKEGKNEKNHA